MSTNVTMTWPQAAAASKASRAHRLSADSSGLLQHTKIFALTGSCDARLWHHCTLHPLALQRSTAVRDVRQLLSNLGDVLEVEVLVALLVVAKCIRLVDTDCAQ